MKELIISRTMVSDILLCIRVRKLKNEVHLETTLWNKHPYVTQKLSAELRKQRVLNLVQLLGIHENICKEFSHSKPLKCSLKYPHQQSGHEIFSLTKTVYLLCLTNLCCTKCVKIYMKHSVWTAWKCNSMQLVFQDVKTEFPAMFNKVWLYQLQKSVCLHVA